MAVNAELTGVASAAVGSAVYHNTPPGESRQLSADKQGSGESERETVEDKVIPALGEGEPGGGLTTSPHRPGAPGPDGGSGFIGGGAVEGVMKPAPEGGEGGGGHDVEALTRETQDINQRGD